MLPLHSSVGVPTRESGVSFPELEGLLGALTGRVVAPGGATVRALQIRGWHPHTGGQAERG